MRALFRTSVIVAAVALGLAVGFVLRGRSVRRAAEAQAVVSAQTEVKIAGRSQWRPAPAALDDSPLATKLAQDLSMSSGVTRWLYWLQALEKAMPVDFPRLALLAQNNPAALRMVAARWVAFAPRHLFDTLIAAMKGQSSFPFRETPFRELQRSLFKEWPRNDPDAAIAALNEPGDLGMRDLWRNEVATSVFDRDVERGVRLMAQWHIESFGPFMTGVAKWASANPRHAAEFILENSLGYVAQLSMETIGKEWAKSDPADALDFAASKPGDLSGALASAVIKQWAAQDLQQAADLLAKTDTRTRARLSPVLAEAWAEKEPVKALAWCDANLSGSSLATAVAGVINGAAAKDIVNAASLVTGMEPSAARAQAAAAIAKQWFPRLSSDKPVQPEMMSWLAALDATSVKRVVDEVQWQWATSDTKSMAAFLAGSSSLPLSDTAYSIAARQLVRQNPADALDWANRLPPERAVKAGSDAFAEWWDSQPDAANAWLSALPASDPRHQPFFESAIRTLAWRPQAAEQIQAMPAPERAAALSALKSLDLPSDRRARLLEALHGP